MVGKAGLFPRTFVFFVLCSCWAVFVHGASSVEQELKEQKKALEKLREALKEEQQALDRLVENKVNVLNQVEQIEENVRLTNEYLAELEQTASVLLNSLKEKKRGLQEARDAMSAREEWIAKRVRSLYVSQKKQSPVFYLFSEGQSTWMKRLFFMRRMVSYDQDLLKVAEEDKKKYQSAVSELEDKQREVEEFQQQKNQEAQKFQVELAEMQKTITSLESDEVAKREALVEMENNSLALAKIIKELEKRRRRALETEGPRVLNKKGLFCEPVRGPIISKYGVQYHDKLKTSTRNLGVEYLGKAGDSVVSAAAGEVVYVNQIPGYGMGLILYNGSGYYSIYGNLSNIQVEVDDTVTGCETLATVPRNGGKPSREIYFEVRKERNSINPVKWLKTMIN